MLPFLRTSGSYGREFAMLRRTGVHTVAPRAKGEVGEEALRPGPVLQGCRFNNYNKARVGVMVNIQLKY